LDKVGVEVEWNSGSKTYIPIQTKTKYIFDMLLNTKR